MNALIILLVIVSNLSPCQSNQNYINEAVNRKIDMTSNIVYEEIKVQVKNKGAAQDFYPFYLSNRQKDHIAYIEVTNIQGVKLAHSKFLNDEYPQIKILSKVPHEGEATFIINLAFTHYLQPSPPQKALKDNASFILRYPAFYLSPFHTNLQQTVVKFSKSSEKLLSYDGPKPIVKREKSVLFGPFENVVGNISSDIDLMVYAESFALFKTALSAKRTVQISHWGKMNVKESYKIKNTANGIKGSYSPLDLKSSRNYFQKFEVDLPSSANSIYVRDVLGHIYNHKVRPIEGRLKLLVPLRIPVFGGWKTDLEIGYQVPNEEHIEHKNGTFKFTLPSSILLRDFIVNKYSLHFVLPEGAEKVNISTLDESNVEYKVERSKEHSYLDTKGKIKIAIEMENVIDAHNTSFILYYDYHTAYLLLKPLVLFSYIFLTLFAYSLVSRLGFPSKKKSVARSAKKKGTKEDSVKKLVKLPAKSKGTGENSVEKFVKLLVKEADKMSNKKIIMRSKELQDLIKKSPKEGDYSITNNLLQKVSNNKSKKENMALVMKIKTQ